MSSEINLNRNNSNILILDSLRCIAACSVMLFHFVCTTIGYIDNNVITSIFSLGSNGVQMFFVISGFILPWSMSVAGYKLKYFFIFFFKRLVRLEPPYFVSIALVLLVFYLKTKLSLTESTVAVYSGGQIAAHFFYLVPFFDNYKWLNQVYWTLAIEFQYYIFIAITFALFTTSKYYLRFLMYGLCLAGPFFSNSAFLPVWLPFFLMGIVLYLQEKKIISQIEFATVIGFSAVIIVLSSGVASILFAAVTVVAIRFFSNKKVPIADALGKMSYSIYLFHPVIGASFINVLSHRYTEPFQKLLVIISGIIITLLSSAFFYRFVEKPSKRLSSSIKYK